MKFNTTCLYKSFKWIASTALILTLSSVSHGQTQSPEYINIHGSACQPANLGQSINFQTSWGRRGVANVNAIGSGRNFFVVCPLVATDDNNSTSNGTDVYVHLRYEDRDTTNRISCTGYRLDSDPGPFLKTVTVDDASTGTGSFKGVIVLSNLIDDDDHTFTGYLESVVVVCKLVPQSGIGGLAVDHD